MKFIDNIKASFGERRFRKKADARRRPTALNLRKARSVAIVYEEKGESFFILVKQYVKYLKAELGIREVIAMAYIADPNQVPHYQTHRLRYDYFTGKELDFFLEPQCEQCRNFVEAEHDILIDLERNPALPLRYVTKASRARFKVGHYSSEGESLYDMMIKTNERTTFDTYINDVNHYLNAINAGHARA